MKGRHHLIGEIAGRVLGFSSLERAVLKTELWDVRRLETYQLDALLNMLKESQFIPDHDLGEWLLEVRAYALLGRTHKAM